MFDLKARTDVAVLKLENNPPPEQVIAEYVEFTFKDQYVSRSHMEDFKNSISATSVYVGKKYSALGIRGQIKHIVVNGESVLLIFILILILLIIS